MTAKGLGMQALALLVYTKQPFRLSSIWTQQQQWEWCAAVAVADGSINNNFSQRSSQIVVGATRDRGWIRHHYIYSSYTCGSVLAHHSLEEVVCDIHCTQGIALNVLADLLSTPADKKGPQSNFDTVHKTQ